MRLLLRLIGLSLLIFGIYFLGNKIIFTTNVYPDWWRGVAANASVFALTLGVLMLVFSPERNKKFGWIGITVGIVLIFLSSRAVLNPTSLWQFFLSFFSIAVGYKMLTTGRLPL